MTARIGSLFSGYGGLDMAVQAVYGGEVAWYSEIDRHACTVLAAQHPGVPNLGDITAVDWAAVPPIDILTGGYPCQPFSHAGQRKGTNDERHLWPYVRDAIVALRPVVTVLENVDGHRSLGLSDVLGDLADLGLPARWGVVRAADAGAPHGRKRVFITVTQPDQPRSQGTDARLDVAARWRDAGGHVASGADSATANPQGGRRRAGQGPAANGAGRGEQGTGDNGGPLAADATSRGSGALRASRSSKAGPATGLGGNGELFASHAVSQRHDRIGASRSTGQSQRGWSDAAGPAALAPNANGSAGSQCDQWSEQPQQPAPRRVDAARRDLGGIDWGKYAPAIRRWESVTRPAPDPTIPGANGRPRLSPAFVEWMMGLPAGHVTGHGLKPAACLKMLGNGVVPQQAELALRMLAATDA